MDKIEKMAHQILSVDPSELSGSEFRNLQRNASIAMNRIESEIEDICCFDKYQNLSEEDQEKVDRLLELKHALHYIAG